MNGGREQGLAAQRGQLSCGRTSVSARTCRTRVRLRMAGVEISRWVPSLAREWRHKHDKSM